jgi:hypothetical protein
MRIYIAGPITGIFDYRKKFKKVEKKFIEMGHIIINPATLPSGLKDYMPICKAMIDQADAIYFLKGFSESVGSLEEFDYAKSNKIPVLFEEKQEQKTH